MPSSFTKRLRENVTMATADVQGIVNDLVTAFSTLTKDEFSPQAAIPNGLKTNRRSRWEPTLHVPRIEQAINLTVTKKERRFVLPFDAYLQSIVVRGRAQSMTDVGDSLAINAGVVGMVASFESLGTVTFTQAAPITTQQTLYSTGRYLSRGDVLLFYSTFVTANSGVTRWVEGLSVIPRFIPLHMAPPAGVGVIGSGQ